MHYQLPFFVLFLSFRIFLLLGALHLFVSNCYRVASPVMTERLFDISVLGTLCIVAKSLLTSSCQSVRLPV